MSTSLTESERLKLGDLELIIEKGLQTFVEVGVALAQIREQRLYRQSHETFEAYCQDRWGWTSRRARQLIASSEVLEGLPTGTIVPQNEGQARELARVPEDKRADVWDEAVESAPKKSDGSPRVTAAHVRETAERTIPDLPTKKDGSIDKLGAMRAAREASAPEPKPSNGAPSKPKKRPAPKADPSRAEQERTSRSNAYSHIGKVVYFADVVRGEKNREHYTSLLVERPEEFYADQRYTLGQVIQASEEVLEGLPKFVATLKEKMAHV